MDEENETIKKLKEGRKKRRIKMAIGVSLAIVVVVILISAYAFYLSIQDTYWKPQKDFTIPEVDWNAINSSYTVVRTTYDQDGTQAPLSTRR